MSLCIIIDDMPDFLLVLFLGFILGLRHATDADHVVAISTITIRTKSFRQSALIGILWGIGHSVTVTTVGIPIILFSLVIPENIERILEGGVGVMLIILGILNLSGLAGRLTKLSLPNFHRHSHAHDGEKHSHFHLHFSNIFSNDFHHLGTFQTLKPVIIGLVHGLAGSAAIALLILSTITSKLASIVYLFIFHFGVTVGMLLITTLIGISLTLATKRIGHLRNFLIYGSGTLSLILGILIVLQNFK